jgi:hypothetical protein
VHPDEEVPNKTVHQLVTEYQDIGSVCLWQVLTEWQNSWNYDCTDLKQCISCKYGIQLQEFNTTVGFVVLCMKCFMCSSAFKWNTVQWGEMPDYQQRVEIKLRQPIVELIVGWHYQVKWGIETAGIN